MYLPFGMSLVLLLLARKVPQIEDVSETLDVWLG